MDTTNVINLLDQMAVFATIFLALAGMARMIYWDQYHHDKNRSR